MRWTVAAVVALVLAMPSPAPAPPCLVSRLRCRDGGATGIYATWNPAILGGRAAFFSQHRSPWCDLDGRCDGFCTIRSGYGAPTRVAVGERQRSIGDEDGCTVLYVCKKGRRARCRKLAQQGSS